MEGFGPKRATLKSDAVLTVFCFSSPTKHRKLSKARESRALHRSVIEDLTVLYYSFIKSDTRIAKNRKVFKRLFSALSVLDKIVSY